VNNSASQKISTASSSAIRLVWLFVFSTLCSCVYRPLPFFETSGRPNVAGHYGGGAIAEVIEAGKVKNRIASAFPSPVLDITPEVEEKLQRYLDLDPNFVPEALERRAAHYPMLLRIWQEEELPLELLNVALIESGFDTNARSHVGAMGMWQFMPQTARGYGLKVSTFQDQRKDPVLSTIAAAKYLKELYEMFECWHLALAAYNAGPAAVHRAIRRTESRNFWDIVRANNINGQTAQFVPRFIAASLIVQEYERGAG